MSASLQHFPFKTPAPAAGVGLLFRKGSVVTLIARVKLIEEGWGRRVRLHLVSSIGDFSVEANLEGLPDALKSGDWVQLRAMRRHGEGDTPLNLMRLTRAYADCKTAWVPAALTHRHEHVQRLRRLLEGLAPALQSVFTVALNDTQLQRRFFWRVGAADHHGYPGGLFDQSVEAAEYAWASDEPDREVRGLAAMAALLFDLGKAGHEVLEPDLPRMQGGDPKPHRMTARRLERAFERVRQVSATASEELEDVLFSNGGTTSPVLQRAAALARQAVVESWRTCATA